MIKREITRVLAERLEELNFELDRNDIDVEEPSNDEFGDFASNVALELAAETDLSARDLASSIVEGIERELFSSITVAGPGFINFHLEKDFLTDSLSQLLASSDPLGGISVDEKETIQIEFVSSNPTGPLTVGHCRQAVLGDVLASLYRALGYEVETEYYFNDEGRQMNILARTLWARYKQALGEEVEIPEDGYKGEYLVDIGEDIASEHGSEYSRWNDETADFFKKIGLEEMIGRIKEDLDLLGVQFDSWFRESKLHKEGKVEQVLSALDERDGTYEQGGALWLKAEEEGAPKDAVLVKSNGDPTYLLPDIAYHLDKLDRGYDRALVLLGADHQRHVENMKAALRVLGFPRDFYQVLINQFVSLSNEGEVKRMSTREGEFVTLKSLVEDLGKDVVRYFMAARKPESHLEFDYELAKKESMDNPVYYLQYAHTRIASIFEKTEYADLEESFPLKEVDLSELGKDEEIELVKKLDKFPEMIEIAAGDYGSHHLVSYGEDLASTFHQFYNKFKVLTEDDDISRARLALCRGVQLVLKKLLNLLGVSAPEKM
ncbi:MAG: arginine--tRNA ligase [Candidatus Bipolaricaulota bacterium]|nr:arginine--tRNA ligase [Candidatus Bipolaricaulota bacterium]MBS3791354.1 arginine--tRNA ligase [Candidatus Bipolaricaulota bacterium]